MATDYTTMIHTGADAYGSDGEKIGTVAVVEDSYFIVEKGFLFTTDVYVPTSYVTGVDDDGIRLSLTKDEIENEDWSNPPLTDTGHATGSDYAAATDSYRNRADAPGTDYESDRMRGTDATLERSEEELRANVTPVRTGAVNVGKHVVTEEQSMDVPVEREEVRVERRPVDRPASGDAFEDRDISIPVTEERASATKEARVVEELDVSKDVRKDTQRVSGTVRREEFDIDHDVDDPGDTDHEHRL
jgi:uncharacterized protein (TIGR02271 family)